MHSLNQLFESSLSHNSLKITKLQQLQQPKVFPHPFGTCRPQNQVHRGKLCFLWSPGTVLCHMTLLHIGLLRKKCGAVTLCHLWNGNNFKTTSVTYLYNKRRVFDWRISHHSTSLGFFRCSHRSPHKTLCCGCCWARLSPMTAHQSTCCYSQSTSRFHLCVF